MTIITLEHIEAKQTELADLIAKFKSQPAEPPTIFSFRTEISLAPGERYAGLLLADDGTPAHHLVLLPHKPDEDLTWQDATAWAASVGGELPTRREQSLLFANLKGSFDAAWYWSCDSYERDGSFAWGQYFTYGTQYLVPKSSEGRARAVRRVAA
jgi:hypothetical protein